MSKSKDDAPVMIRVLQYLIDQNRPYSAIDIFNNLHKEFGKTAVVRALDQLVLETKIKEKTYGKQKVYFVNQDQFTEINDDDLKNMDAEIGKLNEELNEVSGDFRAKENMLENLVNSLTTEEAENYLSRIKKEIPMLMSKLKSLETSTSLVKPEEQKALRASKEKYRKEYLKRKRIACDIVDAILENCPKSKEQLYDEIGIETDDGHIIPK